MSEHFFVKLVATLASEIAEIENTISGDPIVASQQLAQMLTSQQRANINIENIINSSSATPQQIAAVIALDAEINRSVQAASAIVKRQCELGAMRENDITMQNAMQNYAHAL